MEPEQTRDATVSEKANTAPTAPVIVGGSRPARGDAYSQLLTALPEEKPWRTRLALRMTQLGQWLIKKAILVKTKARVRELPSFYLVVRVGVFLRQPAQDITCHRRFTWAATESAAVHGMAAAIQREHQPVKGWKYHWFSVKVI